MQISSEKKEVFNTCVTFRPQNYFSMYLERSQGRLMLNVETLTTENSGGFKMCDSQAGEGIQNEDAEHVQVLVLKHPPQVKCSGLSQIFRTKTI